MKAVMSSIRPKWCELIASGKKTIEVRKTRPKIETPFKDYIYCTLDGGVKGDRLMIDGKVSKVVCGMVIGEFFCDEIFPIRVFENGAIQDYMFHNIEKSCVSYDDIANYIGNDGIGYGWHISELKIYDKPRELREFWKAGKCPYASESGCAYEYHCFRSGQTQRCGETLTRPPQSWCYVEELP